MPTGVQELLDKRTRQTKSIKKNCTMCKKITRHSCSWNGLRLAPEILCVEFKTYEQIERDGNKAVNEFFFSDIVVDERITIHIGETNLVAYALQSVVKLEGRGHEHAVAYVWSDGKKWWKCSDEDVTQSSFGAAQTYANNEQVSMLFYRKL